LSSAPGPEAAATAIRAALQEADLEFEEPSDGRFVVTLPGERKLQTTCSLVAGPHSISVNAFVVRRPDENHEAFYRWLLQRNQRIYGLAFALDRLGDVYLVGRIPLHAVTPAEIDRVLGSVLEQADGAFNTLLELGFSAAIRKEWAWRQSRGEPTRNLDAFRHLADPEPQS
jgi:hypothetical protein